MNVPLAGDFSAQQDNIASLKQKVSIAAAAAAIGGIVSAGISYWAEMRATEEIINAIKENLPDSWINASSDLPDIEGAGVDYGPLMIFFFIPMILFICAVPACGVFGAQKGQMDLVCLFSCFSGLQGCCGCCSLFASLLTVMGLGLMITATEPYFDLCDASVKCPLQEGKVANSAGLVDDLHSVDCLAASVWQYGATPQNSSDVYERYYPDFGQVMSLDCPSVLFLNCTYQQGNFDLSLAPSPAIFSHIRARSWALKQVHEGARSPTSYHVRRLLSRVGRDFVNVDEDPYHPNAWRPDMPEDPLHTCLADRNAMEGFHAVGGALPSVWESVRSLLWISNVLTFISVIISLFGAMYGQQLYQAILRQSQRGAYVANAPAAQGVMVTAVQPAPYAASTGVVAMHPHRMHSDVELA